MRFSIPTENIFSVQISSTWNDSEFVSEPKYVKTCKSVMFWIHVKSSLRATENAFLRLNIRNSNSKYNKKMVSLRVKEGWNSINVTDIVFKQNPNFETLPLNSTINENLTIECVSNCQIDFLMKNITMINRRFNDRLIFLDSFDNKKPLLSISKLDDEEKNTKSRQKRDSGRKVQENFNIEDLEKINKCENNLPNGNSECCLVSYYVSFASLKWSPWISAPAGFMANYCIGRCGTSSKIFLLYFCFVQ